MEWNVRRSARAGPGTGTRQTLIVLSDGRDTLVDANRGGSGERWTPADVHGLARQEGWQIYAVTPFGSITGQLRALVDDTGGRVVSAGRSSGLPATYSSVMEELRHQYLLGYVTDKKDGQIHTIDVRIRSGNYQVTSRRSYQAEGR